MAGARDQHDRLPVQRLGVDAGALLAGADGDVDLRPRQAARREQRVDAQHAQARARHLRGEGGDDLRQLHDLSGVRDGQRELAIRRRRIEVVAVNRLVEIAQRARQRRREGGRARRGHDAAAAADEQRVVERGAQAGEPVADRRRRHVQPARGAHDAALGEHGVEHQQQVQIERRQAHDA